VDLYFQVVILKFCNFFVDACQYFQYVYPNILRAEYPLMVTIYSWSRVTEIEGRPGQRNASQNFIRNTSESYSPLLCLPMFQGLRLYQIHTPVKLGMIVNCTRVLYLYQESKVQCDQHNKHGISRKKTINYDQRLHPDKRTADDHFGIQIKSTTPRVGYANICESDRRTGKKLVPHGSKGREWWKREWRQQLILSDRWSARAQTSFAVDCCGPDGGLCRVLIGISVSLHGSESHIAHGMI
jgi:hypothetical protein